MDVYVAMITGMIAASVGAKIPMDELMPAWRPAKEVLLTPEVAADMYDAAIAAFQAAHPDEEVA